MKRPRRILILKLLKNQKRKNKTINRFITESKTPRLDEELVIKARKDIYIKRVTSLL